MFLDASIPLKHICVFVPSSAEVSITIKNRGNDAFKPEVYGQSIILDMRISSEGLRTYKLRSKTGKKP